MATTPDHPPMPATEVRLLLAFGDDDPREFGTATLRAADQAGVQAGMAELCEKAAARLRGDA